MKVGIVNASPAALVRSMRASDHLEIPRLPYRQRRARSYRFAVEWIAENDEPESFDPEEIAELVTVGLVADIYGRTTAEVARDVAAYREREHAAAIAKLPPLDSNNGGAP